jgi:hypothetical protein
MSVDHIVSRFDEGSDSIDNLQPMCLSHNSAKGIRQDNYWSRILYFVKHMDTEKLRASQLDFVYNSVLEFGEEFAKPYSSFNAKLFSFFQIVGAGKTIGMFALPFALNQAKRMHHKNVSRIDRALIVTKDTTLRHQIAEELRNEPVEFGIINSRPKVEELSGGDKLRASDVDHDFAVMCPNMLWPEVDGYDEASLGLTWTPGIERIINRYPLIMFDEMHYAHHQIRLLLRRAQHSLVFGFTASPISGAGDLLDDMVRMSTYGYEPAVRNDNSMKSLGKEAERILTV